MKIKLPVLIVSLFATSLLWGQKNLDAKGMQQLEERKARSLQNKTSFLAYDTIFKHGVPYCLLVNRVISNEGNEYVLKNLKGEELAYITEAGKVKKTLSEVTGEANWEFAFIKERQKLNIPEKSVNSLEGFIAEQNLVINNAVNIPEVNKLLFVYSERNPQGYTGPTMSKEDSIAYADKLDKLRQEDSIKAVQAMQEAMKGQQKPAVDTTKYAMVERNRKAAITIEDYIIKQDGKIIGRYDTYTVSEGADTKTIYAFKLPNWVDKAVATNGGLGSVNWDIVIEPYKKQASLKTSVWPKKTVKELVEFLVENNYL